MQRAKRVYIEKKDEKVVCWTDKEQWKIEIKGIELHGDFLATVKEGIIILEPVIGDTVVTVEITEEGYMSITTIYGGGGANE